MAKTRKKNRARSSGSSVRRRPGSHPGLKAPAAEAERSSHDQSSQRLSHDQRSQRRVQTANVPAVPAVEFASIRLRGLAFLIDSVLSVVLYSLVLTAVQLIFGVRGAADSATATANLDLLLWLVLIAYFVLFEWAWQRTPGKWFCGLRVQHRSGRRIRLYESLFRNLLRVIDALPYLPPYLFGVILIAGSNDKQRLGDDAARSVVIAPQPPLWRWRERYGPRP